MKGSMKTFNKILFLAFALPIGIWIISIPFFVYTAYQEQKTQHVSDMERRWGHKVKAFSFHGAVEQEDDKVTGSVAEQNNKGPN